MSTNNCETHSEEGGTEQNNVKKRKKMGKLADVMKKLRATSHAIGEDCKCTRYKCFQTIPAAAQQNILTRFNKLGNYNQQNQYLSGLISVVPVKRRRTRLEQSAKFHTASYCYRVRARGDDGVVKDVTVCQKAFLSLHGITGRRVQTIKQQLTELGDVKADGRGKHGNRPKKLSEETKTKVMCFIKSLKGRKSRYSAKVYLPEDLNIAKLQRMYNEANTNNQVGYTTFRQIFEGNFNFAFDLPIKDVTDNSKVPCTTKTKVSSANDGIQMPYGASLCNVSSSGDIMEFPFM